MRVSAGIWATLPGSFVVTVDGDDTADSYEDAAGLTDSALAEGCYLQGGEGVAPAEAPAKQGRPLRRGVVAARKNRDAAPIGGAHDFLRQGVCSWHTQYTTRRTAQQAGAAYMHVIAYTGHTCLRFVVRMQTWEPAYIKC